MSNCTPCTPANDELPIFCDPHPATDTAKRLLVEDEAFCQKALTSPTTPNQILKTNSSGNIQWGTINSVLQSGPVDLGSQPLTTTGAVSAGSITSTGAVSAGSITTTGAVSAGSITSTGAVSAGSITTTGAVSAGSLTTTGTFSGSTAVFNANSSSNAVRITQTGSGNSLVIEDSANPDATPFIIDSEGRILSGTTSSYPTIYGNIPSAQIVSQFQVSPLAIGRYGSNVYGADIDFTKTRGNIAQNHIIVQNGDQLGNLIWAGSNGVSYIPASAISSLVDGIPSATSMPGRIVISTTPTGSITPQERIRIDNAGNVGIGTSAPAKTLHVNGTVRLQGLPVYANNAAAITGGLVADDVYKTATGELRIVV